MTSARSAISAVTSTNALNRLPLRRALSTSPRQLSNPASTYRSPTLDPLYRPDYPENLPIPKSALAALGARLQLDDGGEDKILICMTDRSWDATKSKSIRRQDSTALTTEVNSENEDTTVVQSNAASSSTTPNNQLLSSLGNSLLGLFTSEHLSTLYTNLPTRVLKSSVSAYCGPSACSSVGRELGVGVNVASSEGSSKTKLGKAEGVRVKWIRDKEGSDRRSWEDVMADSVRALVGLVYQERGMNAARTFVHSYFLTRHVDIPGMLNFRNPKHVLGVEMRRLGLSGGIESRLLAESGRHSISPVFSVGLFLPSGLKLAEGTGSSLKMAEHRASINALSSIYLVRAEFTTLDGDAKLPTSAHADFPVRFEGQGGHKQLEKDYKGNVGAGIGEGVFDTASGKKKWRGTTRS